MIKIIYSGQDYKKIEKEVLKAVDYVAKFYDIAIPKITIYIYEDRINFDKAFGQKTESWIVGNAAGDKINIFSPEAMGKQGNHKETEFLPILKHELAHIFTSCLAKNKAIPLWLNEGLSAYIAKQHQKPNDSFFVENNFCEKLSMPQLWNSEVKYGAYTLAAFFIKFLIKKYSFEKIKQLISSLDKHYYYDNFKTIFSKIYKKSLNEVEQEFIVEINK